MCETGGKDEDSEAEYAHQVDIPVAHDVGNGTGEEDCASTSKSKFAGSSAGRNCTEQRCLFLRLETYE